MKNEYKINKALMMSWAKRYIISGAANVVLFVLWILIGIIGLALIALLLADDGDPLDVLVLCSEELDPLTLVRCYPIGVITMIANGRNDEKIIAIPFNDPNYNMYTDIDQLPAHIFAEMRHFFTVYKNLENKETAVNEVSGRDVAINVVLGAIETYVEKFCK